MKRNMLSKVEKIIQIKNLNCYPIFLYYFRKKIAKIKKVKFGFRAKKPSLKPIDVVMTTLPKDFEILGLALDSLDFVTNKIENIYIISPYNKEIIDFASSKNLIFCE